ncbi:PTS system glucitol/sorbitol-specific transporter subunit IIBC [Klebsiella michiganensis]|nr:PTS system glucitol/sorbitol-specific transporter subunit IIBC [Klebsiella michiganensis]
MNTILIPPGPGGYGKGLWLPVASGKKVLSLTGREIHPVAIEIGALTESEIVNGFASIPPDEELLCVVINCAGSLRCGLYPQKGIPTINVLPTWRAGPLAQFITEENYVFRCHSGATGSGRYRRSTGRRARDNTGACTTGYHHTTTSARRGKTSAHG